MPTPPAFNPNAAYSVPAFDPNGSYQAAPATSNAPKDAGWSLSSVLSGTDPAHQAIDKAAETEPVDTSSLGGFAKSVANNLGAGAVRVFSPIVHPLDTVAGIGKTVAAAYGNPGAQADLANGMIAPFVKNPSGEAVAAIPQAALALAGMGEGKAAAQAIEKGGPPGGVIPEVVQSTKNVVKAPLERATAGPQATVMPSAAKLPLLAQSGVEDIFRAAAPTGKNIGFRENLNVAAADLADIARKVDVAEAKGGIINPDMRVRATVDAIRSHLDEMYQTERAPQIERNAQVPVKVGTNPNAIRGLEYLQATAGDVADSQLAQKALDGGTLTVAEADRLAKVANQTLLSFEKMTPEGKMQIQTTNPKVGGLKALDSDLSGNLNDVLKANGEKGLYSYERRYAGLSSVLDQLQTRMNATELKQEGVFGAVGRYTRPVLKVVKEGPSGVPSASQAAVSDVNIGRSLQTGLKKLKSSGITASGTEQ